LNRYAYAHGDPVANTDPTGLAVDLISVMGGLGETFKLQSSRGTTAAIQTRRLAAQMCAVGAHLAGPYNRFSERLLRRLRRHGFEAHHIFQNSEMERAVSSYSRLKGLSIPLFGGNCVPGSPHANANTLQRVFGAANRANAPTFWQLRAQAFAVLRAAGCRNSDATEIHLAAENTLRLDQVGIGF